MSEVEIKPHVRELADSLGKISFDKQGMGTFEEGTYEKSLAVAGLDLDTVKKVQEHHGNLVAAVGLAVGEEGVKFLKKHKDINAVEAEIKFGNDTLSSIMYRSKEYGAGPNSDGGKITKYGVLESKYTAMGSTNKGQLAKVRQHLNNLAAAALG